MSSKMLRTGDRKAFLVLIVWFGVVAGVDISFDNAKDGFFLQPLYHKNKPWDPLMVKKEFIITRPLEEYTLTAESGSYEVEQVIPHDLVDKYINPSNEEKYSLVHHDVVFNMAVSAHIVTDQLSPKWPKLQVLIHASPQDVDSKKRKVKAKSRKSTLSERQKPETLCGHIYVKNNKEELTSICVLSSRKYACVNGISLPSSWWHHNSSIQVSYAFSKAEKNQECASASNSIVPGRSFENPVISRKKLITNMYLTPDDKKFIEEKERDVLIYVPTEIFEPSTIFEVPVKLVADSDLQNFVMSARVRQGLKITGAIAKADSPWQIHVDVRDKKNFGTVTVFLKDKSNYKKTAQIQEVFKWQIQVDSDVSNVEASRVVWSIKYERDSHREIYLPPETKVVSHINIRSNQPERLVTILKVNEILNTAILTGKSQVYPLKVYIVTETDSLVDVAKNSACHSAEVDVLKVSQDCSSVYVDGTERRGSHNVTIITKSGRHTAFTFVKVWIPMDPLDIQLTDSKLSQIRGWKVPVYRSKSRGRSRNKRVVDFGMLTHPSVVLGKKPKKYARGHSCHRRLQQGVVDVYATFFISSPTGTEYYKGRHASLKVTDLLMDHLRISDPRIVSLNGRVIQGQRQGRTEIQVISPSGRAVAMKEIRVGNDKVTIERLVITLVTGITLEIHPSQDIPEALSAVAHIRGKLHTKYQEAILDIALQFSDGTRFPLRYTDPEDYFLHVTSLNHHLIALAPYAETQPYQPRIVALNEGRGECLKVEFRLGNTCIKKRSRPLAVKYVVVDADFSLANQVYSDTSINDFFYGDNRASDRSDSQGVPKKPSYEFKYSDGNTGKEEKTQERKYFNKYSKKTQSETQVIPFPNALANLPKDSPQTQKEPLKQKEESELTPLQIGMYVLLAVFCLAISVFLVNCIVFMMRYRRKRKPNKKHKEPVYQANDWVWIGRATLERNAINTQCSQSLMPAEDFNGNHTPPSSQGSSAQNSAQNSNRNSFVSTIKGSECSIRITANPLPEEIDAGENKTEKETVDSTEPQWDYEAMGLSYDQLADYFDNLKESSA